MDESFVPSSDDMPEEFVDAEGDAEVYDPGFGLEATTSSLRQMWADWLCHRGPGRYADPKFFGKSIGGVPAIAVDAFRALEQALRSSGYQPTSSWAYNCRNIADSDRYSLHSYGIAIDIDPAANPFTAGDPYAGKLQPHHVAAVLQIKNPQGRSVWSWGGNWSKPDRMHFQLDQDPGSIDVDWATVPGGAPGAGAGTVTKVTEEEEAVLTKGDKGEGVKRLQQRLLAWDSGALPEDGADGHYGDETIAWVKKYQEVMGLAPTGNIDGITAALLQAEQG